MELFTQTLCIQKVECADLATGHRARPIFKRASDRPRNENRADTRADTLVCNRVYTRLILGLILGEASPRIGLCGVELGQEVPGCAATHGAHE